MIETSSPATCHSESCASQRCGRRWLSQPTPRQQQQGRRLRRRAEAAHFQHVCSRQSLVCSLVSARVRTRPIAPTGPRPPLSGAGKKARERKQQGHRCHHQHHHATQTRRRENGPGCREESSPPSCCRRKKANERRDNANRATGLAASLPNESATRTRRPHAAVERARRRPPLDPRASSTSGAVRAPKTRREPVAALHAPAVSELPKAVSKQAPFVSVSPSNRILGGFESNPRACRDRTSDAEGIAENPSNRAV